MARHIRRARAAGVRHRWTIAKRLSPTIKDHHLRGWFQAAFDDTGLPEAPLKRILWLIEARAGMAPRRDSHLEIYLNAAIWREILRIKPSPAPKKYS